MVHTHSNGLANNHLERMKSNSFSEESDTRCGIGPLRGPLLQKCATKKVYLLTYSLLGLFQAMFFTYSIAVLTTIEKQFKLKSQTTGILLSGNECSQILLSLLLTYFGGQGHRPRLIAIGMLCSSVASLLIVVPHFVYGRETPVSNSTRDYSLCDPDSEDGIISDSCTDYGQSIGPMVYIFMSQFISGIGSTLFYTLGVTYLDDNAERKQTPMLIGVMSSLRLIGPTFGFGLAGICLRRYVNFSEKTTMKPSDPGWIGAWWLGFIVIGVGLAATSWVLALFPRRLPVKSAFIRGSKPLTSTVKTEQRTIKEFPTALRRLLRNKILICNNISAVFYVFAFSGYMTFLPKYMETQFEQSPVRASIVNGGIGIFFMATGFLLSGYLISRFRPKAWILTVWDVIMGTLYVCGLILFAFVGCDKKPFHGTTQLQEIEILTQCNMNCQCLPNRFAPACSEDGKMNFYSSCHAGCHNVTIENGNKVYSDCECIKFWNVTDAQPDHGFWENGQAISGYCATNCFQVFLIYVGLMGVMKFFSSTGRVTGILIGFRCVDPEDKSFAIGLGTLMISLFAFIPSPIVYGAIIDQACILWQKECGHQGNCWLYDTDKMREYLHFTTAGFVGLGVLFDVFVCYFVRHLDLYNDPEEKKTPLKSVKQREEFVPMIRYSQ